MPTPERLTIHEARQRLASREISSVELTQSYLDRIHQIEDRVKSFVTVTEEVALQQARDADVRIAAGEAGPLTGIPVQIKDVMCTRGIRTTCSSRMLEDYVPVYDATAVEKLLHQGAVLLGKGNMDEFAMGSSTENSAFFPTHNPWDLDRVPGGSSGGAAASVAAGEAVYSLGSDTGGSVRQPASLCGVVGMKPTYGLVSRYGLIAYASSLDQIGPVTQDVTDCAIVLNAITGHDPRDATSLPDEKKDYIAVLTGDASSSQLANRDNSSSPLSKGGPRGGRFRLGVPDEYFVEGMEDGVRQTMMEAIETMEGLGASVERVSLPTTRYALACYYIIAPSECSANLARYDGVKYGYSYQDTSHMWEAMERTRQHGFGPEVRRRIMLGTYALSAGYYDAYYLKAQQARTMIRQDFDRVFQQVDALITPTSPVVAFPLGEKTDDPVEMYLIDVCTLPVNIAGLPGLSIPCGFSQNLPVGMQLIGPHLSEETLLRLGYAYEQATNWHKARPEL
ncbi:MAG: aspartyl/glutamyl-tRNA amidotransferase subunit A [SAR202 cluster bacterium Io17-Chloro-G9]|nr:MAG: aspartyl/glutamyl-tRNA amidotransferase subunit A [SAR202 cluster bacterium Io17-Chloro-G9]